MDASRDPQYKTNDGSALRIWRDTAKNNFQSEKQGRPVFDEVIYVEVISPGSRDSSPVFEVYRKFSEESGLEPMKGIKYDEYKEFIKRFETDEDDSGNMGGTPLSEWPEISRSMAASLKAQNVFTVDALAALPDTKLGIVGPDGRQWKTKAQAFLDKAAGNAGTTALAADLENEKAKTADLQRQLVEMAAKVEELQSKADSTNADPLLAPAAPPAPAAGPLADIV